MVVGGGDGDGDVGEEGNAAVLLQGTRRRSQSPRGRMPPLTCERRNYAVCAHRMVHRSWREAKQLPGKAGLGNMLGCKISFHFLWAILPIRPVQYPDIGCRGAVFCC